MVQQNISKDNLPMFLAKVGFIHNKYNNKITKLEEFEFYKEYFVDRVKSIERRFNNLERSFIKLIDDFRGIKKR